MTSTSKSAAGHKKVPGQVRYYKRCLGEACCWLVMGFLNCRQSYQAGARYLQSVPQTAPLSSLIVLACLYSYPPLQPVSKSVPRHRHRHRPRLALKSTFRKPLSAVVVVIVVRLPGSLPLPVVAAPWGILYLT